MAYYVWSCRSSPLYETTNGDYNLRIEYLYKKVNRGAQ